MSRAAHLGFTAVLGATLLAGCAPVSTVSTIAWGDGGGLVAVVNKSAGPGTPYYGHRCGGVQLSANEVVTATHCLPDSSPEAVSVLHGMTDLCSGSPGVRAEVIKATPLTGSDGQLTRLMLASPLPVEGPAPDALARVIDDHAVIVGWGRMDVGAPAACEQRVVELSVVDAEKCGLVANGLELSSHVLVCTVPTTDTNSCSGDSGGPLYWTADGQTLSIAVVLAGEGCGPKDYGLNLPLEPPT